MKLKKKIASLSAALLCMMLPALPAYAASVTQDSIEVNLSTDKSVYNSEESINAVLNVTNNGEFDILNVSLEGIAPDGYKLSDNSKELLQPVLESKNTVTLKLVYLPDITKSDDKSNNETTAVSSKVSSVNTTNVKKMANVNNTAEKNSNSNNIMLIVLLVLGGGIIAAIVVSNIKNKNRTFSILICLAASGAVGIQLDAFAANKLNKSISVAETVTIDNKPLIINAVVKYDINSDENIKSEAEEYYEVNAEEIISVEDAETSSDVLTEEEAVRLMQDRGFTAYPLTYEYMMDGTYVEATEASSDSNEKHPMYQTFYASSSGEIWTIFIIGKTVAANPASYNLESELNAQLLFAESEKLTSYDDADDKFYVTIPKENDVILKVVEKIDSEQLDKLTREEINNL